MGHGDDRSPDTSAGTAASVQLRGIVKQFGAVEALRGVDLDLRGGEVHALVGENGAGKSTVVKILAGVHRPDLGEVRVDGEPVVLHAPADARDRGIAVIYQQPTLFPDLDVAENVFMGRHPRGQLGGQSLPRGVPYAVRVASDHPVVVQHSRLDTSATALALMTTLAHPVQHDEADAP
jgi:ABC-type sugar transport system ATPase subunit